MDESTATPPADDTDRIADDLPCFRCDYNLRTLPTQGRCPECGYDIPSSTELDATKRWPITAENACGWMAIGLMTFWMMGLGLVLWTMGLVLLTRHIPKNNQHNVVLICMSWGSIIAGVITLAALNLFPGSGPIPTIFIAILMYAHFCATTLMALRITRDAHMPFARVVGYLLVIYPIIAISLVIVSEVNQNDEGLFAVVLTMVVWFFTSAFFWMGLSGELGSKRHRLMKNAGVGPYPRRAEKK